MRTFTVIIHDLPQARAAIAAATEAHVRVELRSPPGGAATLGPGVFKAMEDALQDDDMNMDTPLILDCGNDAGLAMAAIRRGCRHICVNTPDAVTAKLRSMATSADICLHGPATHAFDIGACSPRPTSPERLRAAIGAVFNGSPLNV